MLKTAPASMNLETALECAYRLAASSGALHYTRQAFRPGRGWRWTFSMERPAGSEVFVVDEDGNATCIHTVSGIDGREPVEWQPASLR
jgi:hypothetical protein